MGDIEDLKSAKILLWMYLSVMLGIWVLWLVTMIYEQPISFVLLILAIITLFATMMDIGNYRKIKSDITSRLPKTLCPVCGWQMRKIGNTDVEGEGLFACINTSCRMHKKRIVMWSRYDEKEEQ